MADKVPNPSSVGLTFKEQTKNWVKEFLGDRSVTEDELAEFLCLQVNLVLDGKAKVEFKRKLKRGFIDTAVNQHYLRREGNLLSWAREDAIKSPAEVLTPEQFSKAILFIFQNSPDSKLGRTSISNSLSKELSARCERPCSEAESFKVQVGVQLKKMVDEGLLNPSGEKKSKAYTRTPEGVTRSPKSLEFKLGNKSHVKLEDVENDGDFLSRSMSDSKAKNRFFAEELDSFPEVSLDTPIFYTTLQPAISQKLQGKVRNMIHRGASLVPWRGNPANSKSVLGINDFIVGDFHPGCLVVFLCNNELLKGKISEKFPDKASVQLLSPVYELVKIPEFQFDHIFVANYDWFLGISNGDTLKNYREHKTGVCCVVDSYVGLDTNVKIHLEDLYRWQVFSPNTRIYPSDHSVSLLQLSQRWVINGQGFVTDNIQLIGVPNLRTPESRTVGYRELEIEILSVHPHQIEFRVKNPSVDLYSFRYLFARVFMNEDSPWVKVGELLEFIPGVAYQTSKRECWRTSGAQGCLLFNPNLTRFGCFHQNWDFLNEVDCWLRGTRSANNAELKLDIPGNNAIPFEHNLIVQANHKFPKRAVFRGPFPCASEGQVTFYSNLSILKQQSTVVDQEISCTIPAPIRSLEKQCDNIWIRELGVDYNTSFKSLKSPDLYCSSQGCWSKSRSLLTPLPARPFVRLQIRANEIFNVCLPEEHPFVVENGLIVDVKQEKPYEPWIWTASCCAAQEALLDIPNNRWFHVIGVIEEEFEEYSQIWPEKIIIQYPREFRPQILEDDFLESYLRKKMIETARLLNLPQIYLLSDNVLCVQEALTGRIVSVSKALSYLHILSNAAPNDEVDLRGQAVLGYGSDKWRAPNFTRTQVEDLMLIRLTAKADYPILPFWDQQAFCDMCAQNDSPVVKVNRFRLFYHDSKRSLNKLNSFSLSITAYLKQDEIHCQLFCQVPVRIFGTVQDLRFSLESAFCISPAARIYWYDPLATSCDWETQLLQNSTFVSTIFTRCVAISKP